MYTIYVILFVYMTLRKISDITAIIFIFSNMVLGAISIFSIWGAIGKDALMKSVWTVGFLLLVSVIILIAEKSMESKKEEGIIRDDSTFVFLRNITSKIFIAALVTLALIGVLSIWEVLSADAINKTLGSIAVISFVSLVIIGVAKSRENTEKIS